MSEHRILRTAIAAKIQSLPNVGQVHLYERYAAAEKALRAIYATGDRMIGWLIRRTGRREDAAHDEVYTDWEIRGYLAFDDAAESELQIDDLVDSIIDAFRMDPRLGRLLLTPKDKASIVPDLADSGPCMFAGVLCHGVKLTYTTRTEAGLGRTWE